MLKSKKALGVTAIGLSLTLIVGISAVFIFKNENKYDRLREKYPIIKESDYSIDDAALEFEERVSCAPNIVKIEVIEQLPDCTVRVEDSAVGISADIEFCQFKVKLLSNITEEKIVTDNDGTFVITFAKDLEDSYPNLTDDTNAICSVEAAAGAHSGKYLFFDRIFYYTDSDMALAAYEGDDSPARKICTEKELLNKIKKIRANK